MEAGEAPRGSLCSSARPPTFCSSAEAGSGLSADMAPRQRDGGAGKEGSREGGKQGRRRAGGAAAAPPRCCCCCCCRLLPHKMAAARATERQRGQTSSASAPARGLGSGGGIRLRPARHVWGRGFEAPLRERLSEAAGCWCFSC